MKRTISGRAASVDSAHFDDLTCLWWLLMPLCHNAGWLFIGGAP